MKCPDCYKEMELIIPNNTENYYKCHFCGVELSEDEAKDE